MTETDLPPDVRTIADLPFHVNGRFPRDVLVRRCRAEGFQELSTREFFERIRDLSLGLRDLGVGRGDRVAIVSESRPEWTIADLAIVTAGAVTVPVYPTLPAPHVRQILADCGAKAVIASDASQAAKVVEAAVPSVEQIVVIDPDPQEGPAKTEGYTLQDVMVRGHGVLAGEWGVAKRYRDDARAVQPDDLATIIYTSGTTGEPKGVMLTHRNLVSNVESTMQVISVGDEDEALTFLPLSHAFERLVIYLYLFRGVTITFAESIETLSRDLPRVRPTVMTAVPRVFEKIHARVMEAMQQAPATKQALFRWAVDVGLRHARARFSGRRPGLFVALQHRLADRLVLAKIRERTGGRLTLLVSGSAPLAASTAEFFMAAGLPVVEGYGLTESAPVLTVNPPEAIRVGTVGKAVADVELRIADDGEILARGPNIMQGYYRKPDATAATLDQGWLRTGDIGEIDPDGYLRITDRKKDLIVTSGGKKVAPQPIEGRVKRDPLVTEAVIVGEGRKFTGVLIVPDFGRLRVVLAGATHASPLPESVSPEELVARDDVRVLYQQVVDRVNDDLAQYERIKKFALLPREFSADRDELTPTLKVKRKVVGRNYADVIEKMYGEP